MTTRQTPELKCASCGEQIVPGEQRSPTPSGPAHNRCLIDAEAPLEWTGDAIRSDGLWTLFEDREGALPEYVVQSAQAGVLSVGPVGSLVRYRDGSVRYKHPKSDRD